MSRDTGKNNKRVDYSHSWQPNRFANKQEKYLPKKLPEVTSRYLGGNVVSDYCPEKLDVTKACLLRKFLQKGLTENRNDVEIQGQDPNSALVYPIKSFDALNLKPDLLKGIRNMGYDSPSKLQETVLPIVLADPPQNLILQSKIGTGKTAAFVLAMLSKVDVSKKYPQVLCLLPRCEQEIETGEVAILMAKFCPEITVKCMTGATMTRGIKLTEQILIGTPGNVVSWGMKFKSFDLKKITLFVLDEAKVMIEMQGLQDQCIRILKDLDPNCRLIFSSHTYDQSIIEFVELFTPDPAITVRLRPDSGNLDNIQHFYIMCEAPKEKYNAVKNIYETADSGQIIIFCCRRLTVNLLAEMMSKDGHVVLGLTSDLTLEQRVNVLDQFQSGQAKVLIATDVFVRDIHFQKVTIAVNFELPVVVKGKADYDTYWDRIGEIGSSVKHGIAINLVDSQEAMDVLKKIQLRFNIKMKHL